MPIYGELSLVGYEPALAPYFRDLNLAWLQKYFEVEPIDEEMLSRPEEYILSKGGHIFFAKTENGVVGTFALMKEEEGVYELGKMAVTERFRGQKVGNAMLQFALHKAKQLGAQKVILYSNTKLEPAIHLYKKYGFVEVPLGQTEYQRSNIKMEKTL